MTQPRNPTISDTQTMPFTGEAASQTAILEWIDEVRAVTRSAPWAELLEFDGIDAMDILLSPVFLTVLNTLRKGEPAPLPASQAILSRLHDLAYQGKTAALDQMAAWRSAAPAPTDVLLWSRDITHTIILHPVAQALAEQGTPCRLLACQAKVYEQLRQRDPNTVFSHRAWPRVLREARRDGVRRRKRLFEHGPWQLPNFPGAKTSRMGAVVRDTVLHYLPLVSESIANAQAALDVFQPRVLVVGNDLTIEGRAGCRVAAARGVPTAMFMHGNITGDALQAFHLADRVLVFGNIHRQDLIQQGIAAERIEVCGPPNLDRRPKQTNDIHPMLQERLGLSPREPWVLVATSGPGHRISHRHHHQVIEHLMRLSRALPEVNIVVKLHRKDRLEYYQQGLKDCESTKLVVVSQEARGFPQDIFEWLQGCRIVLTGASTVAVEAMLMDVPVITMDFCDEIHDVDFIDSGATCHVSTPEALEQAVSQVLAAGSPTPEVQAHVHSYLHEAFFALDGKSSSRGAKALAAMIPAGAKA